MAIPTINEVEEQLDETELHALANSYFLMAQTAAWKHLMSIIDEQVDKAQQEHFSSRATEPLQIIEEKLRWQQRVLVRSTIQTVVDSQLTVRKQFIEENQGESENEYSTLG